MQSQTVLCQISAPYPKFLRIAALLAAVSTVAGLVLKAMTPSIDAGAIDWGYRQGMTIEW